MANYVIELSGDDGDLERSIDRSLDRLDRLQNKASSIDIGGKASGAGMGGSGGGGGLLARNDPWGKLEDARADRMFAAHLGLDTDQMRPFQLAESKAELGVTRANAMMASGGNYAVMRRMLYGFSPGAGGMGQMLMSATSMLGPEAMLGGAAAYAAYRLAEGGMGERSDFRRAYYGAGGTGVETGALTSIGRFLGRSGADEAGAAESFGNALHAGTYGAGYFRSRGIVDFGGLTTNKATNYLAAVRALANEPDASTAMRVARDTGLQSELFLRDLPASQREELLNGMMDAQSPSERRSEARYQFMKTEVGSWWSRQLRAGSDMVMTLYHLGAAGLDWIGPQTKESQAAIREHMNAIGNTHSPADEGDVAGYSKDDPALVHGTFRGKPLSQLTADERAEYDRLYGNRGRNVGAAGRGPAQARIEPGMVGGGPRAQAALPPGVKENQLSQNIEGYGRYVGGYYG